MRTLILLATALALTACDRAEPAATVSLQDQVVEASCGQCNLDLAGSGCDLAIRMPAGDEGGKACFVTGFSIDDFGDAHAEDGFCACVRQARVTGRLEQTKDGARFHATAFELLPLAEAAQQAGGSGGG